MVAGNAASALARIQTPAAVVALENILFHDNIEVAEKAESLLAESSRESISRISRLLPGITAEERRKLTARLRSGRHQDSQELLATILCIDNVDQRRNLIALLEKADREMVRLMQACIKVKVDDQVEISIAPLMLLAELYAGPGLPDWSALLGLLAAGTLEKPDDNRGFFAAACRLSEQLWHERLLIAQLAISGPALEKWQCRAFSVVRLLACFSSDPTPMNRSMNELKYGRAYARSMAAEYIEARAGRRLSQQIVPLVDGSFTMPDSYEKIVELARSLGVLVNSDEQALARQRLVKFEVCEE
jgi:hypothetical protein